MLHRAFQRPGLKVLYFACALGLVAGIWVNVVVPDPCLPARYISADGDVSTLESEARLQRAARWRAWGCEHPSGYRAGLFAAGAVPIIGLVMLGVFSVGLARRAV
jgi:hypothetical protein